MTPYRVFAVLALSLLASSAIADEERRQMGKHEHGHGVLNIAIEGSKVVMSLEAPGSDIVGFEHKAETDEQKAAIESGKAKLGKAGDLFEFTAAANCKLASSSVELASEEHADHHEGHEGHEAHDDHHSHDAHHEDAHSEFHAKYEYACDDVTKLGTIKFGYFDVFKGTVELDVTVLSDKGSAVFEVNRDNSTIELGGKV